MMNVQAFGEGVGVQWTSGSGVEAARGRRDGSLSGQMVVFAKGEMMLVRSSS